MPGIHGPRGGAYANDAWDTKPFGAVMTIDGVSLSFLADFGQGGLPRNGGSTLAEIVTHARTYITQGKLYGGTMPASVFAREWSCNAAMDREADYYAMHEAWAANRPVQIFVGGMPYVDRWPLGLINAGQTTLETSHPLAYNGTTVTHATNPPKAFIDGVAQVIITAGTPTAGQVKVPTSASGDPQDVITVPSGIAGTWLVLRYPARPICHITSFRDVYQDFNLFVAGITVRELPMGRYTLKSA